MWAAGLAGFKSSPFMGLGFGDEYKEFLKNRVDLGLSHPIIFNHRHLHSEVVTTAARLGWVGIASLLFLLVGGLRWFTSGPMRKDGEAKIISSLGLMVIASMIIFPMTDSMFGTTLHPMLYAALIGLAAGALRHHELSTKAELPGAG
jgi:O-antigen ligase